MLLGLTFPLSDHGYRKNILLQTGYQMRDASSYTTKKPLANKFSFCSLKQIAEFQKSLSALGNHLGLQHFEKKKKHTHHFDKIHIFIALLFDARSHEKEKKKLYVTQCVQVL